MSTRFGHLILGITTVGLLSFVAGCAGGQSSTKHEVVAAQSPGHAMACQKCYDEAVAVQQPYPKPSALGTHMISKHMCEDCKTEVTTYTENGRPMIKCAKCAPEGVACDLCRPPKASS